jgi:hypothetical protein
LKFELVINVVMSVLNFSRSHRLNHSQLPAFLAGIDAACGEVYHTEGRWLSRGTVLKRSLALRLEAEMFMNEKGKVVTA